MRLREPAPPERGCYRRPRGVSVKPSRGCQGARGEPGCGGRATRSPPGGARAWSGAVAGLLEGRT